ncbi:tetratricopeptide repeat protein [Solitalea lacus]|uniref:tetratricopeptide repeat protein n=1 Tax=Solitalea lacus TaxID=2911172 RepID=UPI001EDB4033|nr:tetratricopeptide repeat protein [Solitalea lacus]UKJ08931.1 tetratricopeptide repeat protein [Solitalea lacus]
MKKLVLTIAMVIVSTCAMLAQTISKADSLYQIALKHYDNKEAEKAIKGFEEVLQINPKHIDALFNLAALQYEAGNKQKAIDLFQRSAALGDSQSKEILKKQLNVRLNYADTMDVADVDQFPVLLIGDKPEDLFFNNNINTKLLKTIGEKVIQSAEIKKRIFEVEAANKNIQVAEISQVKLTAGLLFGKDGSITVIPADENFADRKLIIDLMTVSGQLGKVKPAQYDGKPVCARYYSIPLMFYKEEKK